MKNTGKIITIALLTSAMPAIVTYLGKTNNIIDYLYKNEYIGSAFDVELFKSTCQIISIVLSFSIILYQQLTTNVKLNNGNQKINGLLYQTKMVFQEALSSTIGYKVNFDIRIFVPVKKVLNFKKEKSLYFQIVNYDAAQSGLKTRCCWRDRRGWTRCRPRSAHRRRSSCPRRPRPPRPSGSSGPA